ncbi:hypothetical protein C8Q79DRAFT_1010244 [Trametes meyenii]|nr:hypothetical protein C8Q79DRAFT_1010244 [Trametes meyenii]
MEAHRAPEGPSVFQHEPARTTVLYGPFETVRVPSMGPQLSNGFATGLPASTMQPHPFSTRNVTEDEWQRFLGEVKAAGAHSGQDIAKNHLPVIRGRGILTGLFCRAMADNKRESAQQGSASVYEVVRSWNQAFFSKRNMEVILEGDTDSKHDSANPSTGFERGSGLLDRREHLLSLRESGGALCCAAPTTTWMSGRDSFTSATRERKVVFSGSLQASGERVMARISIC